MATIQRTLCMSICLTLQLLRKCVCINGRLALKVTLLSGKRPALQQCVQNVAYFNREWGGLGLACFPVENRVFPEVFRRPFNTSHWGEDWEPQWRGHLALFTVCLLWCLIFICLFTICMYYFFSFLKKRCRLDKSIYADAEIYQFINT